jgi:hypothetical protein
VRLTPKGGRDAIDGIEERGRAVRAQGLRAAASTGEANGAGQAFGQDVMSRRARSAWSRARRRGLRLRIDGPEVGARHGAGESLCDCFYVVAFSTRNRIPLS